jgi:hypothetical protein
MTTDGETFQWIARLTRVRRKLTGRCARGELRPWRWVTDRTWATKRRRHRRLRAQDRRAASYALVVINAQGDHPSRTSADGTTMTTSQPAGTVLVDILSEERFTVGAGGSLDVEVGTIVVDEDPATTPRVRILIPEGSVIAGI